MARPVVERNENRMGRNGGHGGGQGESGEEEVLFKEKILHN